MPVSVRVGGVGGVVGALSSLLIKRSGVTNASECCVGLFLAGKLSLACRAGATFSYYLIAEFYLVDRGLRHRLPGFSSLDRLVVLTQGLRRFRCQWSHCGSCPTGPDSR